MNKEINKKNHIINHKGYSIPYNDIDYKKIKNELLVKPKLMSDYNFNVKPFPVYRRDKNNIYLPKFYGIKNYGHPNTHKERLGNNIEFKFNGNPKDYQHDIINKTLDNIHKYDSAILSAGCGIGKTFCGLYIASKIKKKTLVIVHKEFLLNQWIERINEFIPSAKVGIIQQNTIDIKDKDIVIAMLQSITVRKEGYPKETFDEFGFTLIDECHHLSSKCFSKALFSVSTKKMLGLSATPKRKDGLTKVLNWFLGDILTFDIEREILIPDIRLIKAEYTKIPEVHLNIMGKINLPKLITDISKDYKRNQQILNEIITFNKQNRKILVLTERRHQCQYLLKLLLSKNISTGLYIGGMKEDELNISNTKDVILGTYNMISEGYDNKYLDTLILASSRSDIEQSIGRILRQKNNNKPLIIDIEDEVDGLSNQAKKRYRFYVKQGYIQPKQKSTKNNSKILFLDDE